VNDQIEITNHAQLRYRQRVDPSEPFPADRIREMLQRATPTREQVDDGLGWAAGNCVIVTDSAQQAVKTILRRAPGGAGE